MKYPVAALAVLTSLVLATPALAHNPVASAEQACVDDEIVLTATFDNVGFEGETSVTATDSQAGDLGVGTSPATFESTFPGPSRAAGTVTFDWEADDGDSGTLEAPYEAVSGCEAPPKPPPPDNSPPPDKPPEDIVVPGDNPSPPSPPAESPPADTLPLTGAPTLPVALVGLGLLGAGVAIRKLSRG